MLKADFKYLEQNSPSTVINLDTSNLVHALKTYFVSLGRRHLAILLRPLCEPVIEMFSTFNGSHECENLHKHSEVL